MFTYEYFKKYETENNKEKLKELCSRLHSSIVSDYTTDELQCNVNYSQEDYEEFIVKLCDFSIKDNNIAKFMENHNKFEEKLGKIFEEVSIEMIRTSYLDKIDELEEIINNL